MLDNAFKLSIDLMFPPPQNWSNSKKHFLPNKVGNNLFELIFDERNKNSNGSADVEIMKEIGDVEEDDEIYEEKV